MILEAQIDKPPFYQCFVRRKNRKALKPFVPFGQNRARAFIIWPGPHKADSPKPWAHAPKAHARKPEAHVCAHGPVVPGPS